MIPFEYLSFLVFLAIIGLLVFIDWKRIEAHGPLLIRRTKKGLLT